MEEKKLIMQLNQYQSKVKEWCSIIKGTKFNKEENTTVKFVVPLLEMLGWDTLRDMEFEYNIANKDKKGGRFVDIVLYIKNKPKILVEVKPIQDELERGSKQIFRYLSDSRIPYGIVTNGKELVVFSGKYCRKDSDKGRELFRFKIFEEKKNYFIAYHDVLSVISKKYVESEIFDSLANALQTKEYWEWREGVKNISDDIQIPLEYSRTFLKKNRVCMV